jgi:predicted PurR-regulated permease PerM
MVGEGRSDRRVARNAAATGAAILLGGFVALALLWIFRRPLSLLVISVATAAALAPVVAALDKKLPRGLAVALPFALLALLLGLALWLIVQPLAGQVTALVLEAPALAEEAEAWLRQLQLPFDFNLREALPDLARRAGSFLIAVPTTIAGVLIDLGLILFTSIYLLIESPRLEAGFLSLFPSERRKRVERVADEMLQAMGGYIRGTAIDAAIVGVLTYVGLLLIGVDYALVFALLAGLLEFVPIIGPVIAAIPVVIVAFLQAPLTGLLALAFMVVLQQLESNVIMPNIMHSQTPVTPLLALVALSAGGAVGGLIGAIVAIPIAGALRVFMAEVVAPAIRSRTGAAEEQDETQEQEDADG